MSSNIRVVVRVRPLNEQEGTEDNQRLVVQPMDEQVLVFDPKEETPNHFYHGKVVWKRDITKRKNRDLKFAFDYVFAPHCSNQEVFQETTRVILDGVLDGYNCSVFAYGATGAGKTHTMLGNASDPGVMFLTVMELFQRMNVLKSEISVEITVSYLEVYNEQIRDLLLPNGTLPIREDSNQGVVVKGLSLHKPKTAEELMHLLRVGNENRTQHPTDANSESSRSHAVFQVFVRQTDRTANLTAKVKMAKLSLIDLAGSERATMTKNMGMRFREGANINRSLLALGNVINALAENKVKNQHVPYRNSKLTRLLKDSLGGNCQTVMIAAVSPSSLSFEDTYNTLKYADRAKHIKAQLTKNVLSVDMHVSKYAEIVKELRKEIAELKSKLRNTASKATVAVPTNNVMPIGLETQLRDVFTCRMSIRKELLEFESSEREIQWRVLCKERKLLRFSLINSMNGNSPPVIEKIKKSLETCKKRLISLAGRKEAAMSRLKENTDNMKEIEAEITKPQSTSSVAMQCLRKHQLEVEVADYRRYNKYLRNTVRCQERESQTTDRLVNGLLDIVRRQYFILKGHGLVTSNTTEDYNTLFRLIDGAQEVTWADQTTARGTPISSQLLTFPLLDTYGNTPTTPRAIRRRESDCNYRSSANSQQKPGRISDTISVTHPGVTRVFEESKGEAEISPPVTQFAGRTPFAKHFLHVHTEKPQVPSPDVSTSSEAQDLDVTYVCQAPINIQPTTPTPFQTSNTQTSTLGQTVTKHSVLQATVTKSKPEVITAPAQVARGMTFDETPPTPKSKTFSFADAVKSPARVPLRSLTDNCMSPLAVPLTSPKAEPKQRVAFADLENISRPLVNKSVLNNVRTLKRVGFPSMFSQTPDPKYQPRRVTPRYMQATKSVANRTNSASRLKMASRGSDENKPPGRKERIEKPLYSSMQRFRSKSVPSLKS